jgi:hypothetical protein
MFPRACAAADPRLFRADPVAWSKRPRQIDATREHAWTVLPGSFHVRRHESAHCPAKASKNPAVTPPSSGDG